MRVVSLLAAAVCLLLPLTAPAGSLSGRRAPGFSLMDGNYNQHDLADYRGKVVLVEFMRTDCPVCQSFTGIIERIRTKFGPKVAVLTIVNTPPESQASVQQFISNFTVKNPILFDCGQAAASYLKITPQNPRFTLPHIFLVDAKGQIREDWGYEPDVNSAYFTGDAAPLMKVIEKLVAEADSPSRTGAQ